MGDNDKDLEVWSDRWGWSLAAWRMGMSVGRIQGEGEVQDRDASRVTAIE